MSKSILQTTKECYLCRMEAESAGYFGRLPSTGLHKHHVIFGKGNRKRSERYGLWVYLCVVHHEYGPQAVHTNREIRLMLSRIAERAFEKKYSKERFYEEFGQFYTDDGKEDLEQEYPAKCNFEKNGMQKKTERRQQKETGGMEFIDTDLEKLPF